MSNSAADAANVRSPCSGTSRMVSVASAKAAAGAAKKASAAARRSLMTAAILKQGCLPILSASRVQALS